MLMRVPMTRKCRNPRSEADPGDRKEEALEHRNTKTNTFKQKYNESKAIR